MTWEQFVYFAIASVLLWIVGAWAAWKHGGTDGLFALEV